MVFSIQSPRSCSLLDFSPMSVICRVNMCCSTIPTLACLRGASRTGHIWWGTPSIMMVLSCSKMFRRPMRESTPVKSASKMRAWWWKSPWNCGCYQRNLKVQGHLPERGARGELIAVEEGWAYACFVSWLQRFPFLIFYISKKISVSYLNSLYNCELSCCGPIYIYFELGVYFATFPLVLHFRSTKWFPVGLGKWHSSCNFWFLFFYTVLLSYNFSVFLRNFVL